MYKLLQALGVKSIEITSSFFTKRRAPHRYHRAAQRLYYVPRVLMSKTLIGKG